MSLSLKLCDDAKMKIFVVAIFYVESAPFDKWFLFLLVSKLIIAAKSEEFLAFDAFVHRIQRGSHYKDIYFSFSLEDICPSPAYHFGCHTHCTHIS